MTIYLVRHASAGARGRFPGGSDADRPLDVQGMAQAEALARLFGGDPTPAHFLASPAVRCLQTIEPWAEESGATPTADDRLFEGAPLGPVLELMAEASYDAVLCSHGDLIPDLIGHLRAEGVIEPGPLPCKKASVWVLEATDGAITGASYVPPPPTG